MVYILLGSGFEEAEALVTADVLRRADVPVTLAGIGGELITGAHGIAVRADAPVESVKLKEDDMVVLPGGMGGVASIEGSGPAMALIRQAGTDVRLRLARRSGWPPSAPPPPCWPGRACCPRASPACATPAWRGS